MAVAEQVVARGNSRAEMVARGSCAGKILFDCGEYDEALRQSEMALEISRRFGARRFQPVNLAIVSQIHLVHGHRQQAIEAAREAVAINRETGIRFAGPLGMGALALAMDQQDERREMTSEGMAVLDQGCVGHNNLWFYRNAIEALLAANNAEGAKAIAQAAEDYIAEQPLPWLQMIIQQTRALAAMSETPGGRNSLAIARHLLDAARSAGFISLTGLLEQRLSDYD